MITDFTGLGAKERRSFLMGQCLWIPAFAGMTGRGGPAKPPQ